LAADPPDIILNIGCAEGYYAIGLARLMPSARVLAHDIDPNALDLCRKMAEMNGVADRISLGGRVDGAAFAALAGQKVLVVCDIEGAEIDLLDPAAFPALRGFTLVVEAHDEPDAPPVSDELERRFAASHAVTRATSLRRPIDLPAEYFGLSEIDQLLLVWEGRGVPTPWLVMAPR
jgi:threonine dehydrogenase-like Zn-dependent dehydrogenase